MYSDAKHTSPHHVPKNFDEQLTSSSLSSKVAPPANQAAQISA